MSKFSVGEIAILIASTTEHNNPLESFNGQEVEILALPPYKHHKYGLLGSTYRIRWPNGRAGGCDENCLRKKRPPQRDIDKTVSWEDCLWKPSEATV